MCFQLQIKSAHKLISTLGCGLTVYVIFYLDSDEITAKQLMAIAKETGTRWQLLASDLGVPRKELLNLADADMQPEDKCAQMLMRWKISLPAGNNGKKELIHALESCERHDLVVSVLGPRAGKHWTLGKFCELT